MGVLHQYQHYYSEIVPISFIDGGNWSIAGKTLCGPVPIVCTIW